MKRWIHASIDEGYTTLINNEVPQEIEDFLDIIEPDYTTTKNAVDAFFKEYKLLPSSMSMDSLDIKYDEDKGRFYRKYRGFADKCKEVAKSINPSGYGRNDYKNLKIRDLCRSVDYNFPYGWKYMVR